MKNQLCKRKGTSFDLQIVGQRGILHSIHPKDVYPNNNYYLKNNLYLSESTLSLKKSITFCEARNNCNYGNHQMFNCTAVLSHTMQCARNAHKCWYLEVMVIKVVTIGVRS